MLKEPLVSVIINCFNGEKYLQKSIESVISQKYKNWEIIFWDNCSTDKSSKIFKNYNDDRLKYYLAGYHTKFLYEARNYALKMKTTKLFNVCDLMRIDNKYGKVNACTLFIKNINATKKLIHTLGMSYKTEID